VDPKGRSKEAKPLRVSEAQAGGCGVTFANGEKNAAAKPSRVNGTRAVARII